MSIVAGRGSSALRRSAGNHGCLDSIAAEGRATTRVVGSTGVVAKLGGHDRLLSARQNSQD